MPSSSLSNPTSTADMSAADSTPFQALTNPSVASLRLWPGRPWDAAPRRRGRPRRLPSSTPPTAPPNNIYDYEPRSGHKWDVLYTKKPRCGMPHQVKSARPLHEPICTKGSYYFVDPVTQRIRKRVRPLNNSCQCCWCVEDRLAGIQPGPDRPVRTPN
jgi:hypothetical protein